MEFQYFVSHLAHQRLLILVDMCPPVAPEVPVIFHPSVTGIANTRIVRV